MSNFVFVLDTNKQPLEPCSPTIAKKLLKAGQGERADRRLRRLASFACALLYSDSIRLQSFLKK